MSEQSEPVVMETYLEAVQHNRDSVGPTQGAECGASVKLGFAVQLSPTLGYVSDVESAEKIRHKFELLTDSKYSTYRQSKDFGKEDFTVDHHKVCWEDNAKLRQGHIAFDHQPYIVIGIKMLDCQHGPDRHCAKKRRSMEVISNAGDGSVEGGKKRRKQIVGKKFDCPAQIYIRDILKFPDYSISTNSTWRRKTMSEKLRKDLASNPVEGERRFYVKLPQKDEHTGHEVRPVHAEAQDRCVGGAELGHDDHTLDGVRTVLAETRDLGVYEMKQEVQDRTQNEVMVVLTEIQDQGVCEAIQGVEHHTGQGVSTALPEIQDQGVSEGNQGVELHIVHDDRTVLPDITDQGVSEMKLGAEHHTEQGVSVLHPEMQHQGVWIGQDDGVRRDAQCLEEPNPTIHEREDKTYQKRTPACPASSQMMDHLESLVSVGVTSVPEMQRRLQGFVREGQASSSPVHPTPATTAAATDNSKGNGDDVTFMGTQPGTVTEQHSDERSGLGVVDQAVECRKILNQLTEETFRIKDQSVLEIICDQLKLVQRMVERERANWNRGRVQETGKTLVRSPGEGMPCPMETTSGSDQRENSPPPPGRLPTVVPHSNVVQSPHEGTKDTLRPEGCGRTIQQCADPAAESCGVQCEQRECQKGITGHGGAEYQAAGMFRLEGSHTSGKPSCSRRKLGGAITGVLTSNKPLTEQTVDAVQALFLKQFPHVQGFQDTHLGQELLFANAQGDWGQLMHDGDRWAFVTSVNCKKGSVKYYDSVGGPFSALMRKQIACIVCLQDPEFPVDIQPVQHSQDLSDCGPLAIAFAVSILFGENPAQVAYDTTRIRQHLLQCLQSNTITPFPKSEDVVKRTMQRLLSVEVFCMCNMPLEAKVPSRAKELSKAKAPPKATVLPKAKAKDEDHSLSGHAAKRPAEKLHQEQYEQRKRIQEQSSSEDRVAGRFRPQDSPASGKRCSRKKLGGAINRDLGSNKPLSERTVDAVQVLLLEQFPLVQGFQDSSLGRDLLFTPAKGDFGQLMHDGDHWVFVTSLNCEDDSVKYYDSVGGPFPFLIRKQIACVVCAQDAEITVDIQPVQHSQDLSDSGPLAIAFAVSVLLGENPAQVAYDTSRIRQHLLQCLHSNTITSFPRSGDVVQRTVQRSLVVELFCMSRMPWNAETQDTKMKMGQCDSCGEWWHSNCCGIPESVFKEGASWKCPRCEDVHSAVAALNSLQEAVFSSGHTGQFTQTLDS